MKYIAGIDPGTNTGYALWEPAAKRMHEVSTLGIIDAMEKVKALRDAGDLKMIVIEDARLRSWFGDSGRERLLGAGSVRRDCGIWTEFAERHQIPLKSISPQQKGRKIDKDTFAKITGWAGRTSEHGRDAGVLAMLGDGRR